ncbi:hypothetical protein [Maricaulis sp. CAU 1757]
MIQLLTSLIEWLAILALSSIGIDYDPKACDTTQPTQYQITMISHVGEEALRPVGLGAGDDCRRSDPVRHTLHAESHWLVKPPIPLDS